MIELSSCRPYLLRAFYKWLLDNNLTPHLLIDFNVNGIKIPIDYPCNKLIVLNIAPHAVVHLTLNNDMVQFEACFSGISYPVIVPMRAILAIYAPENNAGTVFKPEVAYEHLLLLEENITADFTTELVMSTINSSRKNTLKIAECQKKLLPSIRGRGVLRRVK